MWALARGGFRRRRGLAGLAVLLALGIGVAIMALEAARRTERAYPSYLGRSEVGELVVNPSLVTDQVAGLIASTPGVRRYASHSALLATPDRGDPRPQSEVESDPSQSQLLVSSDGRYVDQDRPVVRKGRMIRSGAEAFVSVESAKALGLDVGDALPLAFWSPSYLDLSAGDTSVAVEPIGRAEATVVGIGVFSDEVLVDELYPRRRILVSPDVAGAFDCTPPAPDADDPRTIDELFKVFSPPGCALTYRYFSLQVDGGDDGARAVADALTARFAEASERLPAAMRANDIGFVLIPSLTSEDRVGLERSLEPAVTALNLFGVGAGITTLVVVLLVALRIARRDEGDARTWLHLGATRTQRVAGIAFPLAAAGAAGLAGAFLIGWMGSGIGPVASARSVEPAGRAGMSGAVVLMALGPTAFFLAAALPLAAAGATRSRRRSVSRGPSWLARTVPPVGSTALWVGVRAAVVSSGASVLLAASVAAVVAVLATVVFTTSLNRFVSDPERFGWPYDAAVVVGFGYGGADKAAVASTLDHPDVEAWGLAALDSGSTIDGEPVPFVAALAGFESIPLPVIEGALPDADGEIALGALTAERLGLAVGDRAKLTTPYGEREAIVSGVVVLPTAGPFESDRVSLGTGALLSEQFTTSVLGDAERLSGVDSEDVTEGAASFVVIDLADGVDSGRFLAGISDEFRTWDLNGFDPFVYADPVRPAPVADVAAMKAVPMALVGVFALAMLVGLGLGIAAATRARRRELSVLRALGFVGRQLRASVRWHALCVVGVGLVIGTPVGLALGRVSYRSFADRLGFLPEPVVLPGSILAIGAAALGMGLLAAAGPARQAARASVAELRYE